MFTILVVPLKARKSFWFCKAIDFIWSKSFAPEYFITFCILFRLSAFQNAILIWPRENNLTTFTYETTIFIRKPNLILICCITIGKKRLVHNKALELDFVKHLYAFYIRKEMGRKFVIT